MRFSLAILAVTSLALSACANMSPGLRPNGWAQPAPHERVSDGTETPAVRVADATHRRSDGGETGDYEPTAIESDGATTTSSGLMIPVAGILPSDLHDSFHAPRSGGRTHHAIDISAPRGTPIVAAVDGAITRKHWNRLGGRTLYLTSADGRFDYYYAHLDSYADGIEIGSEVRKGDVLGTVGSTGNARGPHLHFQVLDKSSSGRGTPVNPYHLLQAADLADAR